MSVHNDWIHKRAFELWHSEGGGHGNHSRHWLQAEDEYWSGPGLAQSFESWINKAQPSVRLIIPKGSKVPADLGPWDWKLLGAFDGTAAVKSSAAEKGYAFIETGEPVPDGVRLRDNGSAGR